MIIIILQQSRKDYITLIDKIKTTIKILITDINNIMLVT